MNSFCRFMSKTWTCKAHITMALFPLRSVAVGVLEVQESNQVSSTAGKEPTCSEVCLEVLGGLMQCVAEQRRDLRLPGGSQELMSAASTSTGIIGRW